MYLTKTLLSSLAITLLAFTALPHSAKADLIGSNVSLGSFYQQTSSSSPIALTTTATVPVNASSVEIPSVAAYEVVANLIQNNFSIRDNAIDIGATSINETFENTNTSGVFGTGYMNDLVFTFESAPLVDITGAVVDPSSTLGVTNADLSFEDNQLFVNYSGVAFDPSSVLQIDLVVLGGPDNAGTSVPEPASLILLATGIIGMGVATRHHRRPYSLIPKSCLNQMIAGGRFFSD